MLKKIYQSTSYLFSLFFIVMMSSLVITKVHAASFSFTFAGDYGGDTNADGVLNGIKNAGVNFNLAVGDLRYSSKSSPSGWGSYVKGIVGANFPFEIVSGNHDASSIDQYTPALPDHIGGVTGQYGKEYYFDYPTTGPIARFILTAPNEIYSYPAGSTHYNFVSNAIDDARAKGIKWVFVGMHKNCLDVGPKSCEIGADLMNLLINKRVDVVLQGHDHQFGRTKQLSCATVNSYKATCVVNAGNSLTKGAGTVFIINGNGGAGHYATNTGDPEYPYFAVTNDTAWGYGKFTVTDTQLSFSFVKTTGGAFSDSFTITGSGSPSTGPTSSPSIAPTNPAGPTPTTVPGGTGTTRLAFTVFLHGIGKGGDNVSPNSTGNNNPVHATKTINVTLTDGNNTVLPVKQGTLSYNSTSGNFQGTVDLGTTFTSGPYLVRITIANYLSKLYSGIVTITKGQTVTVPTAYLVNGDSNGDNKLSVLDYNMILDCFADLTPAKNCADPAKKLATDLTDDGNVNQFDYNLFLRELSVQSGQ